jgi:hypothetical protein
MTSLKGLHMLIIDDYSHKPNFIFDQQLVESMDTEPIDMQHQLCCSF